MKKYNYRFLFKNKEIPEADFKQELASAFAIVHQINEFIAYDIPDYEKAEKEIKKMKRDSNYLLLVVNVGSFQIKKESR